MFKVPQEILEFTENTVHDLLNNALRLSLAISLTPRLSENYIDLRLPVMAYAFGRATGVTTALRKWCWQHNFQVIIITPNECMKKHLQSNGLHECPNVRIATVSSFSSHQRSLMAGCKGNPDIYIATDFLGTGFDKNKVLDVIRNSDNYPSKSIPIVFLG